MNKPLSEEKVVFKCFLAQYVYETFRKIFFINNLIGVFGVVKPVFVMISCKIMIH